VKEEVSPELQTNKQTNKQRNKKKKKKKKKQQTVCKSSEYDLFYLSTKGVNRQNSLGI